MERVLGEQGTLGREPRRPVRGRGTEARKDHRTRKTAPPAFARAAGVSAEARASTPMPIFSDPRQVELLPDDATATRVVLRGPFTRLVAGGSYTAPACG